MKVAVIGSRTIHNADIGAFLPRETTLIISGGAKGVDSLTESYAKLHGLPILIFRPDYEKYGREAPLIRNRQIVDSADLVIALWNGCSRGTMYTVRYAKEKGTPVRLFRASFW